MTVTKHINHACDEFPLIGLSELSLEGRRLLRDKLTEKQTGE
jgi:hypothetical protein